MTHTTELHVSGNPFIARFSALRTALKTRMEQRRVYRKTLAELDNLSFRELDDLGLNKFDIETIAYKAAYK